jgi:ParB family transcriptional regulator, chromosome partitioning protein
MVKKGTTPSYLQGRDLGRKGGVDFAVTDAAQRIESIRQEAETLTDFSAVPVVPFDLIDSNPWQPRRRENESKLQELINNMKDHGITQAIIGRRHPTIAGRVQIAFGHRRVKAAQRAGQFTGYPILLRELSDTDMRLQAIGENRFREDLTPLDEGYTFKSMIDAGFTQEETAAYYQVSRGYIRERMELTEDDEDIIEMVTQRPDTVRAARELRKVDDREVRERVIQSLLVGEISGAQVLTYVQTLREEKQRQSSSQMMDSAFIRTASDGLPAGTRNPGAKTVEKEHEAGQTERGREEDTPSVPVGEPRKSSRDHELIDQIRMQSASLLEQSRLKTMGRQLADYGKRLDQRRRLQEDIPHEEVVLLESVYKLVVTQLDKLGLMKNN